MSIRDCIIVNNVIIVLRIILGKLVYLEIGIYVLQKNSKSFTNNYQTRLYKIIIRTRYKLIIYLFFNTSAIMTKRTSKEDHDGQQKETKVKLMMKNNLNHFLD